MVDTNQGCLAERGDAWPVGALFFGTAVNPATALGFGTWTQSAVGRLTITPLPPGAATLVPVTIWTRTA